MNVYLTSCAGSCAGSQGQAVSVGLEAAGCDRWRREEQQQEEEEEKKKEEENEEQLRKNQQQHVLHNVVGDRPGLVVVHIFCDLGLVAAEEFKHREQIASLILNSDLFNPPKSGAFVDERHWDATDIQLPPRLRAVVLTHEVDDPG